MSEGVIQPHNVKPAAIWNAGALDYDKISERVADAIEHCVLRLAPLVSRRGRRFSERRAVKQSGSCS
jgi:hypothetical protein